MCCSLILCLSLCVLGVWENNLFVRVLRRVYANVFLSHARTVRTLGKLSAYFMLYAGAFYYCANDTRGVARFAIGKGSALLKEWWCALRCDLCDAKVDFLGVFGIKSGVDCAKFARHRGWMLSEWVCLCKSRFHSARSQNIFPQNMRCWIC